MEKTYNVGIFGSAIDDENDRAFKQAEQLGTLLADCPVRLITGACRGIPYTVISAAKRANPKIEIWGYSPVMDIEGQRDYTPNDDLSVYSQLIFTPRDFEFVTDRKVCFKYRNVLSVANCDAGICIAGRWGTLNEFTNLVDMGKIAGVLTGTGGIADQLPDLYSSVNKAISGKVFFNDSPQKLVRDIIQELQTRS